MRKKILVGAVVAVAVAVGGLHFYANQRMRTLVDARLAALVASGRYEALSYESLNVGLSGTFTMRNLHIQQEGKNLVVQTVRVSDFDALHETPWHLDLELEGLQFPDGIEPLLADVPPLPRAVLTDLAQNDTLPLAAHYRYDYAPEERERIDSNIDLRLPQSFSLNMQNTTLGIPLEALSGSSLQNADPMEAMTRLSMLMNQGELPTATLTLTDQGLLDTVIQHGATNNGMSPDEFRALLISRVNDLHLFTPPNMQTIVQTASAEVASFLNGNSTLQLRLNPEFGGSFVQLQPQIMGAVFSGDFKQAVELLHLEIENLTP